MRAVIQRVSEASVTIEGIRHAAIGPGLLVLLGIESADTQEDIEWLSAKIVQLRIFNDENGQMNHSLSDIGGELLLISQFTLMAATKKGNRPSFIRAARPEQAMVLYEQMIGELKAQVGTRIKTGVFGADMKVALCNDGPVTIWFDTKNKE
ncbi:MAG: D-tyrosyl-tRNA(Tyr) deacylase [Sphingomonadales bacterium]|nr:D-tyrosyl-tRNA(Tyr) deacylase [Sphingomonadales bacterium]